MSRLIKKSFTEDSLEKEEHVDGNEADLERYSTSGSESDSDDDDDDDIDDESESSLTKDLDSIGRFSNFKIPNFWSNISLYNNKEDTPDENVENNQVSNIASTIGAQTISRREQVTNFIEDLKSGFSLQSALDRLQTIRSVLETSINETIDNNVDTDLEDGEVDEENYEPQVIKAAVEPKDVPILDQVIIPENKQPIPRRHNKKSHKDHHHNYRRIEATNSELEELAYVSQSELNDEMFLRRRIKKIRRLSISEEEKNRLTQKLMMGAHYDKIRFVDDNGDEVLQITADQQARKAKENELEDQFQSSEHDSESSETGETEDDDLVIVNEEDKTPTYHNETMEIFGCPHYQRNCKMECPRCKKWFGCPICHDESITDHKFIRENTNHIMCLKCFNVQEPSDFCDQCDIQFALYYCSKCKLYDNDENKDIYHCDDCGICRLGLGLGQDFFHCKGCNACLSIELQDDHRCIERATQSDCPICGEYMFTSVKPVVFMSCGHAIHQGCYEDHSKHSYKCPTCQKTVLNMEAQFRVLDMEISLQPLPQPYCQWTCVVSCNDCNAKSSCSYHVLGLKCDNCKSYNTVQLKLIKPEESDYESDISTTTNNLRRHLNNNRNHSVVRNLRNVPIRSSHLLNTNYNIENMEADDDDDDDEQDIGDTSKTYYDKKEKNHRRHRSNTSNTSTTTKEAKPQHNTSTTTLGSGGPRTLTLPQQLLNNFDNYLNNIQDSSEDSSDDDEQDFLRVNKSLRNRFISDIFSDSTQDNENVSIDKEAEEELFDGAKTNDTEVQSPSMGVAGAIRDFLVSGSLSGMINDMNNDGDDDMDDDDDNFSDENINGF